VEVTGDRNSRLIIRGRNCVEKERRNNAVGSTVDKIKKYHFRFFIYLILCIIIFFFNQEIYEIFYYLIFN